MKYFIGFIAPYKRMAQLFQEVCEEMERDIVIFTGDLEAGALKAAQLEEEGCHAVISRGGTAMAIKEQVRSLPVITIHISGFDIIRRLHEAREMTEKVLVSGFEPFTTGSRDLGRILGMEVEELTLKKEWYREPEMIREEMRVFKKKGFSLVVGDNISVKTAKELQMKTLLIRSGKESLRKAILEAEKVAWTRRNEIKKTKHIQSIIQSTHEGIISLDQEGIIEIFNPRAEEIFGKKAYQVIGRKVQEVLPSLNLSQGQGERRRVWSILNKKIAIHSTPIHIYEELVGHMITCQEISQIQRMEQKIREELYLKGHVAENTFDTILGKSHLLEKLKEEAKDYARVDSPILIYGETGTGKELFAQSIHNYSQRKDRPFVAFNCAAFPDHLLESELFGYVKGAFTGAKSSGKAGLFEQAHQGTIFLDEIGEISLGIQVRLLRVLQEQKVRRLGDEKVTPIDVRIILATNKELMNLVKEDLFRKDLYYRINVLNLTIPPLRERREDIPILVHYFIERDQERFLTPIRGVSPDGMALLKRYRWPGNVRQLENITKRLMVRAKEGIITKELVQEVLEPLRDHPLEEDLRDEELSIPLHLSLEEMEKMIIQEIVKEEGGNRAEAARRLGIGRTTLWRRLKES